MKIPSDLFEKFAPVISADRPTTVRDSRLLIEESGDVKVYYAPFEYINKSARIALVGITPGPTQMTNANAEARRALISGRTIPDAMRLAKETASFSGEPMRGNLINQLNHWGIPKWLGLNDAGRLFAGSGDLVHLTSLLRFPVFVRDEDYRGAPDMLRYPLLRRHLMSYFVAEVRELEDAIFFGLGPKVQSVLHALVREGVLDERRVIGGLLHPSGNNTYRIKYLTGDRKMPPPHMTTPASYDEGRVSFQLKYLGAVPPP